MSLNTSLIFPSGVHSVLVTPFDEETGNVDYDDLNKWVAYQTACDVIGLVLLGSTSESGALSRDEKIAIVKRVHTLNMSLINPKFITIGISGSNNIRETIDFAIECIPYCDAFMITVPHYAKPPQRGIVNWFKQVCSYPELQTMPIILYNIPGRTCINMLPETFKEVCDACPNIVAIKEASGSLEQMQKIRQLSPHIKLFSGDDGLTIDVIKMGGSGVISVASNVVPTLMTELTRFCLIGEFEKADIIKKDSKFDNFLSALFCESNPIPVKYMLNQVGVYKSHQMRTPLDKLHESKHNEVLQTLWFTGPYSGDINAESDDFNIEPSTDPNIEPNVESNNEPVLM